MKTILVSGASGIVGYGCLKSLRETGKYRLIGTSIYDDLVAKKFSDIFIIAPHTGAPNYLNWLTDVIEQYRVDILIPGIEIDMYEWNKHRDILEQSGAKVLLNSGMLIALCENKWNFYLKLASNLPEFAIPTYMENNYNFITSKLDIPFIMKPLNGYGAKGVVLIHNEEEYRFYRSKHGNASMAQKYIRGEEYTIGAMFDEKSNLCAYISMKRKLSVAGYTEEAEVVDIPQIENDLAKLGKVFRPIGVTNFQFICDNKKLKLLEINPRISSSNYLRTKFGYNECEIGIRFLLENQIPSQPRVLKGRAKRYIEEVIQYDRDNI